MNRRSCSILLALGLAIIASLPTMTPVAAQTPTAEGPLQVVASFSILGDLVKDVGGDAVRSRRSSVPVSTPTPTIRPPPISSSWKADVIFENGLGFEPWLDGFFASAQPPGARVVVTEGITPRRRAKTSMRKRSKPRRMRDEHGEFDPHVWHDVANAIVMVGDIRDALVAPTPPVRRSTRRTPRHTSPT